MAHATIKALLAANVIGRIAERFSISEDQAMKEFYQSSTAASLSDNETGLYGQSALYIFGLYCEEKALQDGE